MRAGSFAYPVEERPMTIEYAVAFVIGAFLIVVILMIWRKLRSMVAQLSEMQKQLILLCHKFHLWLLRMRRTQCGHL
jgi:hypothetical protein